MNKHQFLALSAFLILAAAIAVLIYLINKYGWLTTAIGIGSITLLSIIFVLIKNKLRYSSLLKKYGDKELVRKIMRRTLWQGQTTEQVIDAIGEPKDIDEKVLKTKTKQTWKYFPSGRRRYGLRVKFDDGEVVGWENKL